MHICTERVLPSPRQCIYVQRGLPSPIQCIYVQREFYSVPYNVYTYREFYPVLDMYIHTERVLPSPIYVYTPRESFTQS